MANIANDLNTCDIVIKLAHLLEEHKAEHITLLYVGDVCSWTDYFLICTVRSSKHLSSLYRELKSYLGDLGLSSFNNSRSAFDSGWVLLDFGDFVVHLMENNTRKYYELEKLWFNSKIIYQTS
jgi:ribosome-associated protein